jgi:hypothetical protein
VDEGRRNATLVLGLGSAQLIAWGSLYYAIAVLGEPMRVELGATSSQVFGAFSWSLAIAGVLAPAAGRALDRYGGRAVLVAGALIGAAGFVVLASAHSFPLLFVGWSLNGLAMALGLYDACFAAVGQVAPRAYRVVVTGVTLVAGFASSIAWPLSYSLLQAIGWRGACEVYALGLLLSAAVYAILLPARSSTGSRTQVPAAPRTPAATPARVRVLSWAFAGTALIGGSVSAHLPGILSALELEPERAVWVASSLGALQVVGRVTDLYAGTQRSAAQLGALTFSGLLAALLLLLATPAIPSAVVGFALLYGVSNGLLTIARATVPVELGGLHAIGTLLGAFSAPSLLMRAFAPLGFALLMSSAGTIAAVASLVAVAMASRVAYFAATRASTPSLRTTGSRPRRAHAAR